GAGFVINVWPTGTATGESPAAVAFNDTPKSGGGASLGGGGSSLGGGGDGGGGCAFGMRWTTRGGGGGLSSGGGGLTSGGGSFSSTSISIGGSARNRFGSTATTATASRPWKAIATAVAAPTTRAPPGRGVHR